MDRRKALTAIGLSSVAGTLLSGCSRADNEQASDGEGDPDDGKVDLLFVQTSEAVRFQGNQLTLVNVDPKTLFFSDRPDDVAGFLSYEELVELVGEGPDSFVEEPPNATLVVLEGDNFEEAVMELSAKPRLEGADLIFPSVTLIQGTPPASGGASALFIDTIGRPLTPVSVAGVHRRRRRRRNAGPGPSPGPGPR